MRVTPRPRIRGAGPEIDRESEATDHLTGTRVPFHGATVLRGDNGWFLDKRRGFPASPPSAGEIKRHLRKVAAAMRSDMRAGLRYELLQWRGLSPEYISAVMRRTAPEVPRDRLPELARDSQEVIAAALARHFGGHVRFRPAWVGRI